MNTILKSVTFAGVLCAASCAPPTPQERAEHVARDIAQAKYYVLNGEDPHNICWTRECRQEMKEMMDSVHAARAEEGARKWEADKKALKKFFSF